MSGSSGHFPPLIADNSISITVRLLLLQKLAATPFLAIESEDTWQNHQELSGKPGYEFKDEVAHAHNPVVNDRLLHVPFPAHGVYPDPTSCHSLARLVAHSELEDYVREADQTIRHLILTHQLLQIDTKAMQGKYIAEEA